MGSVELYRGKRESYYIYRIDLAPDPLTGERKQRKVTRDRQSGARWTSIKACRLAMQAHEQEIRTGVAGAAGGQTLGQYMAYWLHEISPSIKPNTALSYAQSWNRLAPHLGTVQLDRLSTLAIQQAFRALTEQYAAGTVRLDHRVLNMALRRAVQWRMIATNPAVGIVLPSAQPVRERRVWTAAQVQAFLLATQADPDHALWRTLLDTGMRIGEALALTWSDLDLAGSTPRVTIRRTLTRNQEGQTVIGQTPKTRRSRRTNRIHADTAAALQRARRAQDVRRAGYGAHWAAGNLVFDRGDGEMMLTQMAYKRLEIACRRARLPVLTPHELRHTMITLAAEQGAPLKLLADRVGHSGTSILEEIYAHATEAGDAVVSDALYGILSV